MNYDKRQTTMIKYVAADAFIVSSYWWWWRWWCVDNSKIYHIIISNYTSKWSLHSYYLLWNSAHLNGSIPLIGCQFDDTLNFELEMFQVFAYALFYVSTVLWIFNRYLQSVWLLCYAQQTDYYNRWNIFVKHCLSL